MTLDAATLSTTATAPIPTGYSSTGIVASPNGAVYLLASSSTLGNSGAQSEAFQFHPATNTITGQFALVGSQVIIPSADGAFPLLISGDVNGHGTRSRSVHDD